MSLALSTSTVTTATPATVTAVVKDATGAGVVGQVVKFRTVDGLGYVAVAVGTHRQHRGREHDAGRVLGDESGADQVIATTTVNGTALQASQGFQLTAASVAIASVTADTAPRRRLRSDQRARGACAGTIPGTPLDRLHDVRVPCLGQGHHTPGHGHYDHGRR